MRGNAVRWFLLAVAAQLIVGVPGRGQVAKWPGITEGDYVDFLFD